MLIKSSAKVETSSFWQFVRDKLRNWENWTSSIFGSIKSRNADMIDFVFIKKFFLQLEFYYSRNFKLICKVKRILANITYLLTCTLTENELFAIFIPIVDGISGK